MRFNRTPSKARKNKKVSWHPIPHIFKIKLQVDNKPHFDFAQNLYILFLCSETKEIRKYRLSIWLMKIQCDASIIPFLKNCTGKSCSSIFLSINVRRNILRTKAHDFIVSWESAIGWSEFRRRKMAGQCVSSIKPELFPRKFTLRPNKRVSIGPCCEFDLYPEQTSISYRPRWKEFQLCPTPMFPFG